MASDADTNAHAYLLGRWPTATTHALITPARRWRVVLEELQEAQYDIILNTVLRVRQAGEKDAVRIADLLQLPEDLIRYLLGAASQQNLSAPSGNSILSRATKVGWIYRDVSTGELWPQPVDEVPPTDIRWSSRVRGRFEVGSVGRPLSIDVLRWESKYQHLTEPGAVELARFGGSSNSAQRTAVVSKAQSCYAISPVVRDRSGLAVLNSYGTPHVRLSRLLNEAERNSRSIAEWAKGVPPVEHRSESSSNNVALRELNQLVRHLNRSFANEVSLTYFTSQIELALGGLIDQLWEIRNILDTEQVITEAAALKVALLFALNPGLTGSWITLSKSDVRRKALEFLVGVNASEDILATRIADAGARYDSIIREPTNPRALVVLAEQVLELGQLIEIERGGASGEE